MFEESQESCWRIFGQLSKQYSATPTEMWLDVPLIWFPLISPSHRRITCLFTVIVRLANHLQLHDLPLIQLGWQMHSCIFMCRIATVWWFCHSQDWRLQLCSQSGGKLYKAPEKGQCFMNIFKLFESRCYVVSLTTSVCPASFWTISFVCRFQMYTFKSIVQPKMEAKTLLLLF